MTVKDLLFKAGGLNDPQHKANTFLQRADLVRYDKNFINQEIISFSLLDLYEDSDKNFSLMPEDKIIVYKQSNFNNKSKVQIFGLVKNPGLYEYSENMTIEDLIIFAGGLNDNKILQYIVEISRRDSINFYNSEIMSVNIINRYSVFFKEEDFIRTLDQNNKNLKTILKPNDFVSLRSRNINSSEKFVQLKEKYCTLVSIRLHKKVKNYQAY